MNDRDPPEILFQEMIEKIQQRITLKAVILFGSRARGTFNRYSDYDLVIVGDFQEDYFARSRWVIKLAPLVSVDLFCYTSAEFEAVFAAYRLTAIDAIGDGVPLYDDNFFRSYKVRYQAFVQHGLRKTKCSLVPPVWG